MSIKSIINKALVFLGLGILVNMKSRGGSITNDTLAHRFAEPKHINHRTYKQRIGKRDRVQIVDGKVIIHKHRPNVNHEKGYAKIMNMHFMFLKRAGFQVNGVKL